MKRQTLSVKRTSHFLHPQHLTISHCSNGPMNAIDPTGCFLQGYLYFGPMDQWWELTGDSVGWNVYGISNRFGVDPCHIKVIDINDSLKFYYIDPSAGTSSPYSGTAPVHVGGGTLLNGPPIGADEWLAAATAEPEPTGGLLLLSSATEVPRNRHRPRRRGWEHPRWVDYVNGAAAAGGWASDVYAMTDGYRTPAGIVLGVVGGALVVGPVVAGYTAPAWVPQLGVGLVAIGGIVGASDLVPTDAFVHRVVEPIRQNRQHLQVLINENPYSGAQ